MLVGTSLFTVERYAANIATATAAAPAAAAIAKVLFCRLVFFFIVTSFRSFMDLGYYQFCPFRENYTRFVKKQKKEVRGKKQDRPKKPLIYFRNNAIIILVLRIFLPDAGGKICKAEYWSGIL